MSSLTDEDEFEDPGDDNSLLARTRSRASGDPKPGGARVSGGAKGSRGALFPEKVVAKFLLSRNRKLTHVL